MTMENPQFEDVFPIEHGDFPMSCYFSGVYTPFESAPPENSGFVNSLAYCHWGKACRTPIKGMLKLVYIYIQ